MCTFQAESCLLVCHACSAVAPPQPMRDGELADSTWEGWTAAHRSPCAHVVKGVLVHDGACGQPLGTTHNVTYVART